MKMKNLKMFMGVLLILTFVFSLYGVAPAGDDDEHGVVFTLGEKEFTVTGIKKEYAEMNFVKDVFGVGVSSLENNNGILVKSLNYNKGLIYANGKTYVHVPTFLNFFDVSYTKVKSWKYSLDEKIPMFTSSAKKSSGGDALVIRGAKIPFQLLRVKKKVYVPIQEFCDVVKVTPAFDRKNGLLKLNGKQVERWTYHDSAVYGSLDDINQALGMSITVVEGGIK